MDNKRFYYLIRRNFLFWLSRKIGYPLVAPDVAQINFTFQCNLRCKMCSMYKQMNFLESQGRKTEIDSDTIRKIIKEIKILGVNNIIFIGGEPLLRKDLFDLLSYSKSFGLGTGIVTNGVLLNEDNIMKCFESGVDWLSISIDAAFESTFSRIRGENVLGTIIKNIETLNAFKKIRKKDFPKLTAVFTIMDDNIEELLDMVYLCRRLGVDKIIIQPLVANNIDQTKRDSGSPGFIPDRRLLVLDRMIDGLINYKKESLRNFNFIANKIENLDLMKKYFRNTVKSCESPCYAGYNRIQIVQEGKLYFCVNQDKYEADFGDIRKDSLKSLWFSKEAKFSRKVIRKCKSPCLQWCSYRDEFAEVQEIWQKRNIFNRSG